MQKMYIVQGKITVAAEAMGAMVKRSGRYDYRVEKLLDTVCMLAFTDNGKDVYNSIFSMDDAKRADLIKPGSGWIKYPRAMLMSKALSQGARIVCPHVISGVYTFEDFSVPTDDEGNVNITATISAPSSDDENDRIADEAAIASKMQTVVNKADAKKEQALKDADALFGTEQPTKPQEAVKSPTTAALPTPKVETVKGKVEWTADKVKTIGDLFTACKANFGILPDYVVSDLGLKSRLEISDPKAAYLIIETKRQAKS
jgi:hypothetical protein